MYAIKTNINFKICRLLLLTVYIDVFANDIIIKLDLNNVSFHSEKKYNL